MARDEMRDRRRGAGWRPALALACALALWFAAAPAGAQEPPDELFGATSRRADNLNSFPRWSDVMQRYGNRADPPLSICKGDVFRRCMSEEWKGFLDEIAGENRVTQIRRVNERMNRSRYTTDMANWGQADYWETPNQFFRMNGDCEDYAIAKYLSLRALGFPDEDLRLVVLNDLNLRVGHAVLVVIYQGTPYVMDNQIAQVVPASAIHHYQPLYALNEKNWWFFRPKLPAS